MVDVLTTERFGTKPLRTLMAWSFFESILFSSMTCVLSQHLLPDVFGCSCKATTEDAVDHGQGYCVRVGGTFQEKMAQPASTFMLVAAVVVMWILKLIACAGNVCCSRWQSKVYVFS